jgi:hypothetical protein
MHWPRTDSAVQMQARAGGTPEQERTHDPARRRQGDRQARATDHHDRPDSRLRVLRLMPGGTRDVEKMAGPVTHVERGLICGVCCFTKQNCNGRTGPISKVRFVGLDVHKDSIVIAVADWGRGEAQKWGMIPRLGEAPRASAAIRAGRLGPPFCKATLKGTPAGRAVEIAQIPDSAFA